jgi:hypothetical protein
VCEKPHTVNVRDFCASCYGNGLPLRFATSLYLLVNAHCNDVTSQTIYTLYDLWHSDHSTIHHASYFNVMHGKYMWINGSNHPRLEPVLPEPSDITLKLRQCKTF